MAEAIHPAGQRHDNVNCRVWIELSPAANVLFRPEEVHAISPEPPLVTWPSKPMVGNPHNAFRLCTHHLPISNLDHNGLATVEARGIHPDRLPWKEPADRQRLKASLAEPLLRALDRDSVLRWQIAKGRQRGDVVSAWVNPDPWNTSSH